LIVVSHQVSIFTANFGYFKFNTYTIKPVLRGRI